MNILKIAAALITGVVVVNSHAACRNDILPGKPNAVLQLNADGTVIDTKTNLVWMKCSVGLSGDNCETGSTKQLNWKDALAEVAVANAGAGTNGFTDWRLPSVNELASLVEGACYSPAINESRFPQTAPVYWSSTPSIATASSAWAVDFGNGNDTAVSKSTTLAVRLVRGGL